MKRTNILVVGATGRVGGAALRFLVEAGGAENLALFGGTRRPESASALKDLGVTPVALDLDDTASVEAAVQGMDRLLLLTGYTVEMLRQSKRVLDAATRAGIDHVVHIGASGNPTSEVAHWGWHRMIEAYIETAGFTWTHLQPEAFMQNVTGFGWLHDGALTNLIGEARWCWVDAEDVGAFAGAALLDPRRWGGEVVRLGYDAATMAGVAKHVGGQIGRAVSLRPQSPHDFYQAAVASGADPVYMACVRDQFLMNARFAIPGTDETFDPERFASAVGRVPATWKDFVARERAQLERRLGDRAGG
ncbi:MAG: NmrA family NAD(P)-binding protein [Myxococcota bacterium]